MQATAQLIARRNNRTDARTICEIRRKHLELHRPDLMRTGQRSCIERASGVGGMCESEENLIFGSRAGSINVGTRKIFVAFSLESCRRASNRTRTADASGYKETHFAPY